MKLSANEAKLIGLCPRNRAAIQQVLILKVAFGPEKLPGLSRNGPLYRYLRLTSPLRGTGPSTGKQKNTSDYNPPRI